MAIVEAEVRCQQLGTRLLDPSRTAAEIEDRVIECQGGLSIRHGLSNEVGVKEQSEALYLCCCYGAYNRVQLTAREPQRCRLSLGAFPCKASCGIVLLCN